MLASRVCALADRIAKSRFYPCGSREVRVFGKCVQLEVREDALKIYEGFGGRVPVSGFK